MKCSRFFGLIALGIFILSLLSTSDAKEKKTVIRDVRVISMTSESIQPHQDVWIAGERITAIAPTGSRRIPRSTKVIEGKGAYLLPGLADMHVHLSQWGWPVSHFNLYLASGVTTVRDLDSDDYMRLLRDDTLKGLRLGPRELLMYKVNGTEPDPLAAVKAGLDGGYDGLKPYTYLTPDAFKSAIGEAHARGRYAVGHIPMQLGIPDVVASRLDEIAHIEEIVFLLNDVDRTARIKPEEWNQYLKERGIEKLRPFIGRPPEELFREVGPRIASMVSQLKAAKTTVCTTLVVDEIILSKLLEPAKFLEGPLAAGLPASTREAIAQGRDRHQTLFKGDEFFWQFVWEGSKRVFVELLRQGVPMVLGTDAGPRDLAVVPGITLHEELRLVTSLGMRPYEAIAACTRTAGEIGARITGRLEFGTVEPGLRADLLLVGENPLEDVGRLSRPLGVMAAGQWLDAAELDRLRRTGQVTSYQETSKALQSGGLEAAFARYRELKQVPRVPDRYNQYIFLLNEWWLNQLGYDLLFKGDVASAIQVFQLNVKEFPNFWNCYDSLGEAYAKAGNREEAIKNYERSLELNPQNEVGRKALEKLRKQAEKKD